MAADISGNDWRGSVNGSQAADRMTDEIFRANHIFGGEITHARIQYWKNQPRKGLVGLKLFAQYVYSGFIFAKTSVVCNRCLQFFYRLLAVTFDVSVVRY